MTLLKCILTNNLCYKYNHKITPKGVMVHSTGANNPNLKRYVQPLEYDVKDAYNPDREILLKLLGTNPNHNDWNHSDRQAGVHAFIGKLADGLVATVQTLPWDHLGWHAGGGPKGSANDTHIAFEICEDDLTDPVYFERTKQEAVELTAMLCKLYDLDPMQDGVIICHQDGYKCGIASNHGDIYGWWPKHNYTMDQFRLDVLADMNKRGDESVKYYESLDEIPSYYRPTIEMLINAKLLSGTGEGLHLSDDMCRTIVLCYGMLGKFGDLK